MRVCKLSRNVSVLDLNASVSVSDPKSKVSVSRKVWKVSVSSRSFSVGNRNVSFTLIENYWLDLYENVSGSYPCMDKEELNNFWKSSAQPRLKSCGGPRFESQHRGAPGQRPGWVLGGKGSRPLPLSRSGSITPGKFVKTQMLNTALWWPLAVKFLAFWKLRPKSLGPIHRWSPQPKSWGPVSPCPYGCCAYGCGSIEFYKHSSALWSQTKN